MGRLREKTKIFDHKNEIETSKNEKKTRYYEGKNKNQMPEIQGPTVTEIFTRKPQHKALNFDLICSSIFSLSS